MAEDGHRKTLIDSSMLNNIYADSIALPPATRDAGRPTVESLRLHSSSRVRFPVQYKGTQLTSPWRSYDPICDLRLGLDFHITIAQEKTTPHGCFAIRRFPGDIHNTELQMLRRIRHDSFVAAIETFQHEAATYAVFEHMPISLLEMQRSRKRIGSDHLPAILGPVCRCAPATVWTEG